MKHTYQINRASGTNQSGFTLIEIMVVIAIIAVLAAMILPNVSGQQDKALKIKAKADIRALETQLTLYKLDNFSYPNSSEGIQALISKPGYLSKLPKDPWRNNYQYSNPGQKNPNTFDVWSFGSDGAAGGTGTAADIGNWDDQ